MRNGNTIGKIIRVCLGIGICVAIGVTGWLLLSTQSTPQARSSVAGLTAQGATPDPHFARAYAARDFHFPQDHGPHPDFQTEWWYYTGNLADANGRQFGYQLTFFRRALVPPVNMPARQSDLASAQIYFAHFALTDVGSGQHVAFEKYSRGAGGLAGASAEPFHVFVEDWAVNGLTTAGDAVQLLAQNEAYSITLTLHSTKPLVTQGDRGWSAKSDAAGNASYYYSFTRLATTGTLRSPEGEYQVSGLSWMDHEWSTSALGPKAQGWDWFSLQLSDQRELMLFQVRNTDGTIDPVSGGMLIEPDGSTRRLSREQVKLDVLERWHSPQSGADYPVRWRVTIADGAIELDVAARIQTQENMLSVVYWEGAMTLQGQSNGNPVSGSGYVELTGYSTSLNGRF
jgi:predicted secreted hydrolase